MICLCYFFCKSWKSYFVTTDVYNESIHEWFSTIITNDYFLKPFSYAPSSKIFLLVKIDMYSEWKCNISVSGHLTARHVYEIISPFVIVSDIETIKKTSTHKLNVQHFRYCILYIYSIHSEQYYTPTKYCSLKIIYYSSHLS